MPADRAPLIIDPFHKMLYDELMVIIEGRYEGLANGSAASFEEYKYQVGYLSALKDVLGRCSEIERRKFGEMGHAD